MNINKPTFFRGRPIIDGTPHKVISATSQMIAEKGDALMMAELVYILENVETSESLNDE